MKSYPKYLERFTKLFECIINLLNRWMTNKISYQINKEQFIDPITCHARNPPF